MRPTATATARRRLSDDSGERRPATDVGDGGCDRGEDGEAAGEAAGMVGR
jgi:hypothetical protein